MDLVDSPIIFIGSGRSGTTIISDIIFRHPKLAFPSNYQEMFPRYSSVNYVRRLFDNSFWSLHAKRTYNRSVFNLNNYLFRPTEGYRMWDYLKEDGNFSYNFLWNQRAGNSEFIRAYFKKMIRCQNKTRLAFKITGPSRIGYLMSIFPDANFVEIERGIIPTISSFMKVDFWQKKGIRQLHWDGAYTDEEKSWVKKNINKPHLLTAFQIRKIAEVSKIEISQYHPKIFRISFEEFLENPQKAVDNILEFVGLNKNKACYDSIGMIKPTRKRQDEEYFSRVELEEIYSLLDG